MSPTPPPARLVIFDLDGTLLDSLPDTLRCFQEAVAPGLGRTPTPREVLDRFGPADQEIVRSWVGSEHADDAIERLYAGYRESLPRIQPVPGVLELLDGLRERGLLLALFTGRGRPSTELLLDHTGLGDRFHDTVTGEEAAHPKPAPDGLTTLLRRLDVAAGEAIYVGDSIQDVKAAEAAGVVPLAVLYATHDEEALVSRNGLLRAWTVEELSRLLMSSLD